VDNLLDGWSNKLYEDEDKLRLISPGTGRMRSPIVHSPFVPALPPIGGLPPTSTTLKTSTSSWTNPERARAIIDDKFDKASPSRCGEKDNEGLDGCL
jgi:hypothetical protein